MIYVKHLTGPVNQTGLTATLAVALALAINVAAAPAAQAQHRSIPQSKAGPFVIDYITEAGKFDRCAATLSPGPNMLRIAYNNKLTYSISVPGVPVPAKSMTFYLGSEMQTVAPQTDARRTRAWAFVSTDVIGELMAVKGTIAIDLGTRQYRWPIGRTSMEDVFVALENCTHTAMGR